MTTLTESQKRRYIAEGNKNKQFKKLSEVAKEQAVESIMTTEYLDLRCDWAFKYVLSDPELLLILLNDFLPEKIASVTSVNTEPKRLGGKEKNVLMDIVAKAKDGREIVIEMQRFEKTNFKARMFYYGSSMVRSQLPKGKDGHLDIWGDGFHAKSCGWTFRVIARATVGREEGPFPEPPATPDL